METTSAPATPFRERLSSADAPSFSIIEESAEEETHHRLLRSRSFDSLPRPSSAPTRTLSPATGPRLSALESKREQLNGMFGMLKFKGHIARRPLGERSETVRALYQEQANRPRSLPSENTVYTVGNVLYTLLFGWWIALVYYIAGAVVFITIFGQDYTFVCWRLAGYYFFPFNKTVYRDLTLGSTATMQNSEQIPMTRGRSGIEQAALLQQVQRQQQVDTRCTGPTRGPFAFVAWCLVLPILILSHFICFVLCEFLVVLMPMAKLHVAALQILFYSPDEIHVKSGVSLAGPTIGTETLLCCFQAVNLFYYKYTFFGMNIILVNLLPFVGLTIVFGYTPEFKANFSPYALFAMALISIIPLAYYIGKAIASISAQSTYAVGATLNATFGSIVEIIIYVLLLRDGLQDVVIASLTGSLLAGMLFIPGICMLVGGLKYKEQHFNWRSAGVGTSLLFVSVAGALSPSLFNNIFASHTLDCSACHGGEGGVGPANASLAAFDEKTRVATFMYNDSVMACTGCSYRMEANDAFFNDHTRPFAFICASFMPLIYIVGLIFSLGTHSKHINDQARARTARDGTSADDDSENAATHGAQWSRLMSFTILVVATALMGLVAEVLVNSVEPILTASGISEAFLGVTLIALCPDIAEIASGAKFALANEVTLAIEVGSSMAVQITLIQMPVLVFATRILLPPEQRFTMVFNDIFVWTILLGVLVYSFTVMDGRSNYFGGATLLCVWSICVAMFYYMPEMH